MSLLEIIAIATMVYLMVKYVYEMFEELFKNKGDKNDQLQQNNAGNYDG